MVIECCSQERTYSKFYGLIGERFAKLNRLWTELFEKSFETYYNTIHRYETNRLRNIARLFGHMFSTDALGWHVFNVIHLNEEETTSSSRIFIKILFQDLSEAMGMKKLAERMRNPDLQEAYAGIFPKDNPRNTRFSINYFTSIGMGNLTEDMREWLQNLPKPAPIALPPVVESDTESNSSRSSYSSRSYSSRSRSYSRSLSRTPERKRGREYTPSHSQSRSRTRSYSSDSRSSYEGYHSQSRSRSRSSSSSPGRVHRSHKRTALDKGKGRETSRSFTPPRRGAAKPPPRQRSASVDSRLDRGHGREQSHTRNRHHSRSSNRSQTYSRSVSSSPSRSRSPRQAVYSKSRGRSYSRSLSRSRTSSSTPSRSPPPTRKWRRRSYSPSRSRSRSPNPRNGVARGRNNSRPTKREKYVNRGRSSSRSRSRSVGRDGRWMRGSPELRALNGGRSASPPLQRRGQIEVRERGWRRGGERAKGAAERARAVDFL